MTRIREFLFSGFSHNQRKAMIWLWRGVAAAIVLGIGLFVLLAFDDLPSVEELENPQNNEATQIMGADGTLLGRYYTENRVMVDFADLGIELPRALVATEDERYFEHSGIDWYALGRAIVKTGIMGDKASGGGSTITQQLAKLLFTEGGEGSKNIANRLTQKMKEWIIAIRLERKYTKQEIMAMYLNRYDFINGAQGIRAASENYFGKRPKELNTQEAAMLVGMLKNASLYNPLSNPEGVINRRNVVFGQMLRNNVISQARFDSLKTTPLGVSFSRQSHDDGPAPYFRMVLAEQLKEIFAKPQYHKKDGEQYDIYRDGLTVYTTIDPNMQRHAEAAATKHMAKVQADFFRRWKNENPWEYESPTSETETPVESRQRALTKEIRKSGRYQKLRKRILIPAIKDIGQKHALRFNEDDREVARMMRELEEPGYINRLIGPNGISRDLAQQYKQVMKLDAFDGLKNAWTELQATVKKEFDEPVKMRIFTYDNDRMVKDTVLSPMDSIYYMGMILQIGSMSVEPTTGFVRTWIGGVDFKHFQFDHVTTRRQVGSTFKPFLYATSINLRGISPCFQVLDQPITINPGDGSFRLQKSWTPRNASDSYSGEFLTLMEGLKQSKNSVSAFLMQELESTEPVRTVVQNMGIDKSLVPDAPSIALGSVDLTVEQMTGAYTTFGNNGIFNRPVYLLRVEDRTGQTIYEYVPEQRQALSPQANYTMVHMLRNASVGALGGVKGPVGGKTGTTNDHTDGWYMGITPELVVGTWVGGKDRWIRFRSLRYGSGAALAKPFFREFVRTAQADEKVVWNTKKDFYRPRGDIGIELDCDSYYSEGDALDEDDENYVPRDTLNIGGGADFGNSPDFR
ncbi:peptidoglycan glycosyltransferase [Lewinellaceae bacterium SD302]|nr:peptidoglycan glycosyltransferase [Lewinellaceae bacterium SD302]